MSHATEALNTLVVSLRAVAFNQRRKRHIMAENAWLIDLINHRFPGFRGTLETDLAHFSCLNSIVTLLGGLRQLRLDDYDVSDLDALIGEADYDTFVRFLRYCNLDPYATITAHNLVNCDGTLESPDSDAVSWCERYEEYTYSDLTTVRVSPTDHEEWSERAIEAYAFYCNISDTWYSTRNYEPASTVDGDTICIQIAGNYDYTRRSDGDYIHVDDYDEDDEDEGDGVPAYHRGYRNWTYDLATKSVRGFFGFEIEIDVPDRGECWSDLFSNGITNQSFCAERDGSLDDDTGLEIVTRPYSLHELHQEDCDLRALFHKLTNNYGAEEGGSEYGVHVTTNSLRLTRDHKTRFRKFIVNNHAMSAYIARRKGNTYCNYNHPSEEKHSAVYYRENGGAEVRIFRSTVDYSTLVSYAEYVEAVIDWTRDPAHLLHGPLAASLFRHWVCLSGRYPYLAARFPRQTAKEIEQCVLPSSSRPAEFSRKPFSKPASITTPMVAGSRSWETIAAWPFTAASSISTSSTMRISNTA